MLIIGTEHPRFMLRLQLCLFPIATTQKECSVEVRGNLATYGHRFRWTRWRLFGTTWQNSSYERKQCARAMMLNTYCCPSLPHNPYPGPIKDTDGGAEQISLSMEHDSRFGTTEGSLGSGVLGKSALAISCWPSVTFRRWEPLMRQATNADLE